jgi:6-phosphogluconolactonase (cycloisomerase 2 family)
MGRQLLTISLLAGQVFADLHHLFTSSFSTPHLYALEFDDSKDTLTDIANISAHAGHPRISFNYYKSTLYAGEENGFASYRVVNSTGLEYVKSVETKEQCGGVQDASGVTGSPSMVADFANPFNVFGASATGCGEVMPVDSENGLTGVSKPFWYANGSLIQGMAMDEERRTLYSADYQRNGIWVHTIDKTGEPTGGIFVKSPYLNSGPRSVYAHSDGLYVYVLLSRTNAVVVFAVTEGDPASPLTYTGLSYSLLPEGMDQSST